MQWGIFKKVDNSLPYVEKRKQQFERYEMLKKAGVGEARFKTEAEAVARWNALPPEVKAISSVCRCMSI